MTIRFGTDGWRAIIADEFTFDNVRICAQATADLLKAAGMADRGLVVGYDTRFASDRFAGAVADVAAASGVPVAISDGPVPTPVLSHGVVDRRAGGGVAITASHNPGRYNGYKFKPETGGSATDETVAELERLIVQLQAAGVTTRPPVSRPATVERVDLVPRYLGQIAGLVRPGRASIVRPEGGRRFHVRRRRRHVPTAAGRRCNLRHRDPRRAKPGLPGNRAPRAHRTQPGRALPSGAGGGGGRGDRQRRRRRPSGPGGRDGPLRNDPGVVLPDLPSPAGICSPGEGRSSGRSRRAR